MSGTISHATWRRADAGTRARYPLPVEGPVIWEYHASGHYRVTFALPALAADELVVPSFACRSARGFRFSLVCDEHTTPLNPVGETAPAAGKEQDEQTPRAHPAVRSEVDLWHATGATGAALLVLDVFAATPPREYLVCCSRRPKSLTDIAPPEHAASHDLPVPSVSQMTADAAARHRICSPTCVAMLMRYHGVPGDRDALAAACHDRVTNMYGVWPVNLAAAAANDLLGAVELFSDWNAPVDLLSRGIPFSASIRFAKNALKGAPLAQTGGHLVVVRGIDVARQRVLVNDPAAPDDASVPRFYDLSAFTRAWLGTRGAAYLFAPNACENRVR